MLFPSLCSKVLIWISASSPPLLVPCAFFFISLSAAFISAGVFFCCCGARWVLWAPWQPVFWTLPLIDCLSTFHLVLFLEFCFVLSFGPYFFVSSIWQPPCVCFCVLDRAALAPCLSSVAYCRKGTHVDECGFFKSLVVGLPYSSIFWWICVMFVL